MSEEIRGTRSTRTFNMLATNDQLQVVEGFDGYSGSAIGNQIASRLKMLNTQGEYPFMVKNIAMTNLIQRVGVETIHAVVVFQQLVECEDLA
jgi:hypothetical protein